MKLKTQRVSDNYLICLYFMFVNSSYYDTCWYSHSKNFKLWFSFKIYLSFIATLKIVSEVATHINESMKKMVGDSNFIPIRKHRQLIILQHPYILVKHITTELILHLFSKLFTWIMGINYLIDESNVWWVCLGYFYFSVLCRYWNKIVSLFMFNRTALSRC